MMIEIVIKIMMMIVIIIKMIIKVVNQFVQRIFLCNIVKLLVFEYKLQIVGGNLITLL